MSMHELIDEIQQLRVENHALKQEVARLRKRTDLDSNEHDKTHASEPNTSLSYPLVIVDETQPKIIIHVSKYPISSAKRALAIKLADDPNIKFPVVVSWTTGYGSNVYYQQTKNIDRSMTDSHHVNDKPYPDDCSSKVSTLNDPYHAYEPYIESID
jgi:hypothetical protein